MLLSSVFPLGDSSVTSQRTHMMDKLDLGTEEHVKDMGQKEGLAASTDDMTPLEGDEEDASRMEDVD